MTLSHRLIQGPLAGISCAPFRELFAEFILPAYAVTEMISAQDLVSRKQTKQRYVVKSAKEAPLCYQLSGSDPDVLAKAITVVESKGADLIDLNAGCPMPKIRKKHCGSAHIEDPKKLASIVSMMRKSTLKPLTVKIRTKGHSSDTSYLKAAKVIEEQGADAIIVHGRHWTEDYNTACSFEQIAEVKSQLTIPVIANGDLSTKESIEQCIKITGCDGYMIARAAIGQPWLYESLLCQEISPSLEKKIQLFLTHIFRLADLEESEQIALFQARRLLKHYFKNDVSMKKIVDIYQCDSLNSLHQSLNLWLS